MLPTLSLATGEGYVESSDGQCLDVRNAFGTHYAGAEVQQWACGALGYEDQEFTLTGTTLTARTLPDPRGHHFRSQDETSPLLADTPASGELEYVVGTTPTGYCVTDAGTLEPCGAADEFVTFTGGDVTSLGVPVGSFPPPAGGPLVADRHPRGFIPLPELAGPLTSELGQFGQYLFSYESDAALAVAGSSGEGSRVGAVLGDAALTSTLSDDTLWSLPQGSLSSLPFPVAAGLALAPHPHHHH